MKYNPSNEYQEVYIDTLEEISQIVKDYNKFHNLPRPAFGKGGPLLQGFYRGQSNSEWDISPSILRSQIPEYKIIKEFKIPKDMSLFGTIAYIQHHHENGVGTRFIDFTTDLNISVYFACNGNSDKDGAVFLYDYIPHKAEWYSAIVLSELARLEAEDKITVQDLSERILLHYPNIKEQFHKIEDLNGWIISFLDHGFMVIPDDESLEENLRLQRQQGCFFVCGVKFEPDLLSTDRWFSVAGKKQFNPRTAVVPKSLKSGWTLVKIIIPKARKQDILQHLAVNGITEDYLFPN